MQELRDDLSQIFHENRIPLKIDMTKYFEKEKEQIIEAANKARETAVENSIWGFKYMKQETKFINVHLQLVSDTKEILGTAEFSCLGYLKLKLEGIDTFEDVLTEMLKQVDPQNIPTSLTEILNNQNK